MALGTNLNSAAVLIPCYLRIENIKTIFDACIRNGVQNVYFSLDSSDDEINLTIQNQIQDLINAFPRNKTRIYFRRSVVNVGCSVNIVSSIDWVFSKEDYLIVLEDDCIPSDSFFRFAFQSFNLIDQYDHILLGCGSQFISSNEEMNLIRQSKYPFFWGWFTSRKRWQIMKSFFDTNERLKCINENISIYEKTYWLAGHLRARNGFVDVWDTIVSANIVLKNLSCIVPNHNLVVNVGNDGLATNVKSSKFTDMTTEIIEGDWQFLEMDEQYESFVRKKVYGISLRHLITTKITFLLDLVRAIGHKHIQRKFLIPYNDATWLYEF